MFILDADLCTDASFLATILFFKKIVTVITYIIPALLVLFVTIDMSKAVIAGNEDDFKKSQKLAIKRIIYALVVFFAPRVIDASFNLIGKNAILGLDCYYHAKDSTVEALSKAEKLSNDEYIKELEKLAKEQKISRKSANKKITKLRKKANKKDSKNDNDKSSSGNPYDFSNITSYIASNGTVAEASWGNCSSEGDENKKQVVEGRSVPANSNATYIARFKSPAKAAGMAQCMHDGAKNDNIGYCSHDFLSLYEEAKKVNWDLTKVEKKSYVVCSTFVSVCINANGTKIKAALDGFADDNEARFKNTGDFKIIPYDYKKLKRGDIIVKECPGRCGHMSVAM